MSAVATLGGLAAAATPTVASVSRAGLVLGAMVGLGLVLIWQGLPRQRQPTLSDRVLPYLLDTPRPSRLLARPGIQRSVLGALLAPTVASLGRVVDRLLGGTPSIRHRLLRSGQVPDVERFRASQVVWGAAGGVVGLVLSGLIWVVRDSVGPGVLVVVIGVGVGVVARDQVLTQTANRREARMLAEFPTIAELLALAVAAGEGAVGALERVTRLSRGELSGELSTCLADARAGANLPNALQGLAERTALPSLARFVDGIIVAVQRGTPLAEVLRAQAQDVREGGRRAVMESAGKREIAMMVPIVFLVLPVTIVFAIFPGLSFLNFSI